ncbi:MAG: hypothetical protein SFU25_03320 [Candidatus Caenarcaniphilales bacterium]|nr:hypothetical protein [Candidatus Caenarcaniphilales bacterium]
MTISESVEHSKIKVKEELKNELVTREIFEERFKTFEEKFKNLEFRINIMIGIAAAACTVFNPGLIDLMKSLIK